MSVLLLRFLGDVLDCLLILFIMFKNVCNSIFNFLELFLVAFFKIAAASQCNSFSSLRRLIIVFSKYLLSILLLRGPLF